MAAFTGLAESVFKVGCEQFDSSICPGVAASVVHLSGCKLAVFHTATCARAWSPQVSFAADNNFGDVSAKATSQTICASVVGTSCGE